MSQEREHFGIVGGGLLGLTLALRLAERGYRVTVLEAADHVGGLADAWRLGDLTWDRHYHVTLESDAHWRGILRELGLDADMQWVRTRTGFLVEGRLYSLSSVWDFLRFPPLGPIDKLRLAWTIWQASRRRDWQSLEQQPIGEWLIRHSGRNTFERIWLPLLKAKLGDAWQRTSAAFIWATIQRMYAARHSGQKHERFGYLPGGYARTLAAFTARLESLGVMIKTCSRVESVRNVEGALQLELAGCQRLSLDRVVSTLPAPVTSRLAAELTDEEHRRLKGIEYVGIVCASIVLRRPLAGYYVTNVTDPAPFTGVIEMTALVDPSEFGGRTLVYLPKYLASGDPAWQRCDAEIQAEFVAALVRLFPRFDAHDVLAFRVSRVPHVFALSTLGYSTRLPPISTSIPGFSIVSSAQIVNGTLNVNETVKLAEAAVPKLCEPLVKAPRSKTPQTLPLAFDLAQSEKLYDEAAGELIARPG